MAYVTTNFPTAHVAGESRIAGMVADIRDAWTRRRVYRKTLNELQALSARELNDLGLNRSMLHQVAYEAAYGKAK
ncbi:DUF1127 domain-containing protein [Pseudaestuariivita atlantica]|uniref:YjiS-like domain-containing protein n=1 Tax=Pseudaestuariivita atlantica TaxID=1317121 RepID=A0A0L1JTX0_9RHOB|nr:DUF1127 domain-containing protein [Pseudaestuariivita atlantica]KNG95137.1 hypothetical protein ATO11_00325 [Pseudaestuariivita atlantica]